MKRMILLTFALLAGFWGSNSLAATAGRVTLLVIPARYSVMQVAFDIVQRYPAVLVSYQGDAQSAAPLLHAWNGKEWIKISADEYANASFLQVTPGEALLVGDETLLPAMLVSSIAGWCPKVTTIPSIDTATLVNTFAGEFQFSQSDWEWFSKRYNLTLNDENAARRKSSWYDRPAYQDEYSPKVATWFGLRKGGRAAEQPVVPIITRPESDSQPVAPVDVPVQSETLPTGADVEMNAPDPVDAAPAAATLQEEDARNVLQAPPPVAQDAQEDRPTLTTPSQPVAIPVPTEYRPQATGMELQ